MIRDPQDGRNQTAINWDVLIGQQVANQRRALGTSQAGVARQMTAYGSSGWHQTTVAKVESGDRPLRLTEAMDLADILRFSSVDSLIMGENAAASFHGRAPLPVPVGDHKLTDVLRIEVDGQAGTAGPTKAPTSRGSELLTMQEVSDKYRVPVTTLRYWRHNWNRRPRGPKSFRLGKRVVYRVEDCETWLNEQMGTAE